MMQSHELHPGFSKSELVVPNPYAGLVQDGVPERIKNSINSRDGHVCQACGFASDRFMEVVPSRHSPAIESAILPQDYTTLCRSCWLIENLDLAAMYLALEPIWAPELDQLEINRTIPLIYVARQSSSPGLKETMDRLLDIFVERQHIAIEKLGGKKDDGLYEILSKDGSMAVPDKTRLDDFGDGIRFWPRDKWIQRSGQHEFNAYPGMVAHWHRMTRQGSHADFAVVTTVQDWLTRLASSAGS